MAARPEPDSPRGEPPAPDQEQASGWLVEGQDPPPDEAAPTSSDTNEWLAVAPPEATPEATPEPAGEAAAVDANGADREAPTEPAAAEDARRSKPDRKLGWRRRRRTGEPDAPPPPNGEEQDVTPPAAEAVVKPATNGSEGAESAEAPGAAAARRRRAAKAQAGPAEERPTRLAPGERASQRGSRQGAGRLPARVAELEERLEAVESATAERGPDAELPPGAAAPPDVEAVQASITELQQGVAAAADRLTEIEAADAKRVRRFEAEVRKISTEATAELRQTLDEANAALDRRERAEDDPAADPSGPDAESADPDRLERLEAELRELVDARTEERDQIEAILEELQAVPVAEARRQEHERATEELRQARTADRELLEGLRRELAELRQGVAADRELITVLSERFPARGAPAGGSAELIDLNAASFEQLRDLGVSVTQASRLISARESVGGYASLDELDGLSGFSAEQLAALKRAVRL